MEDGDTWGQRDAGRGRLHGEGPRRPALERWVAVALCAAGALGMGACSSAAPPAVASLGAPAAPPPASAAALPPPAAPQRSPEHVQRLERIREQLVREASALMELWTRAGVDHEHGGFHGQLDAHATPVLDADKWLIPEARHLWTFSTYSRYHPEATESLAIARNTYGFIHAHFRDPRDGEYFYRVSRTGERREENKLLYAQAFAIYGLSTFAAVSGEQAPLDEALACFQSIDRRAHDATHRGYDQRANRGWLKPGADKDTNTHIHLLEAFTSLCAASEDATVCARLAELVDVVAHDIVQPAGYAHQEFSLDWRPVGDARVSYGHDLETAWLLLEALAVLGQESDGAVAAALTLGRNSAAWGYDAERGGYFEEGVPGGAVTNPNKTWWVQAEALPALFRLYQRTNEPVYLERLEGTLRWILEHQRHQEHAEWHRTIAPDGSLIPASDLVGDEWKASYHNVRALVLTSEWIAQELGLGARAAPPATPAAAGGR